MDRFELEERLIDFAVMSINIASALPYTAAGRNLANQLSKSGTSPALNYGEAQAAESMKDFIHKVKIILKELRETYVCLRIIKKSKMLKDESLQKDGLIECNELISIFVKSVKTAESNTTRLEK